MRLISIFFFCISYFSFSQTFQVTGVVVDSTQSPLEMASILALKDDAVENYAITNENGKFKLNLKGGEKYILKVSYLGMKTNETEFQITEIDNPNNLVIMLFPDENQLDGVEIKHQIPVIKRGDTLIYNADSFTNGTERKLGDVLKKMPGIQVNDNGEIEVEGKKVSKVMIDGKDFFDGDSKLATKNIPADAVSKVEVLRNYNEVSQMRGLGNDQDNVAINLKLKEGKTNFWFGDVEGGLGEGEGTRYLGKSSLFYYSPRGSVNFIGNSNNTGDIPFTARDYFNFTGGISAGRNSATNFNIPESDLGFLMMQNNKANEIASKFAALNLNYQLNSKWDLSGYSIFNNGRTDLVQESLKNYIETGNNEFNINNTIQKNRMGLAKISSVYKPNPNFQFDYDLFLKTSRQRETGNSVSALLNSEELNPIDDYKENDPISINQKANLYYTLNDKNIFAGFLNHLYQIENPFYRAIVALQPFPDFLPLSLDQPNFNINQNREMTINKFDLKFDYYFVINNLSNFNISLGFTQNKQKFHSSMFQILDNNAREIFEETHLTNRIHYDVNDYFFGFKYKMKQGIITLTPGLEIHNYQNINKQKGFIIRDERVVFLPSFNAIAQIKKSETLRFNYQMTADFTNVTDLAEGYIFSNYNRLFRGNGSLENALFNTWSLSYFNINMYNFTNIFGGINYNRRIHAVRNTTKIEGINLVTSPFNSGTTDELISANLNFEKTFRLFKIKSGITQYFNKLNLIVNDQSAKSNNYTQNYTGSILTNFKKSPHFEVGYSRNISQYDNGGVINTFITDKPFASTQISFLDGFQIVADWSYNNYSNKQGTITNKYSFLEAAISYQNPASNWEFKLEGTNLFDVQSLNTNTFNEFYNSTIEYFVQPRIIMASIIYNL